MSICTNAITSSVEENCENNVGGLKRVLITDYENLTEVTEAVAGDEIVEGITLVDGTQFWSFYYAKDSGMFEENINNNLTIGSTFFEQKVAMTIPNRDESRRMSIKELTQGQKKLIVIVQDANNKYWLFFDDEGGIVTTLTGGSGGAKDTMNGYAVEITGDSVYQARLVDETIIDALLIPAIA